ncbi:hypothetical protein [Bacillus sp. CH30_1T]|uniref:hypothetical protein n=1 Tax=Bacillus sp. CH30_1T TaxID=2604836 RepID=UPI0011ED0864|nr:hypothetical protein [Bacillus sp. CH30_1T]
MALITKGDYKDKRYGQRYNVYWFNYDSPTGGTATIVIQKRSKVKSMKSLVVQVHKKISSTSSTIVCLSSKG